MLGDCHQLRAGEGLIRAGVYRGRRSQTGGGVREEAESEGMPGLGLSKKPVERGVMSCRTEHVK